MALYEVHRYLLMTLDPVHVGTGGYSLGRVDNTIVREPGTRIPKIPGTAVHGAIRSYAARLWGRPEAAGQSQEKIYFPALDPVCYTFGYAKTAAGESQSSSGVVNIHDARILFFPVYSLVGPVWATTVRLLKENGFGVECDEPGGDQVYLSWQRDKELNLGWLMVRCAGQVKITPPREWQNNLVPQQVWNRIVVMSESLFSHVVNSNLEVRTSVSINPDTGAAEEGALFTYEAIPRSTFLTMDVVVDDFRDGLPAGQKAVAEAEKRLADVESKIQQTAEGQGKERLEKAKKELDDLVKKHQQARWNSAFDVVKAGLEITAVLGVGGMGTRGFGRLKIVESWKMS